MEKDPFELNLTDQQKNLIQSIKILELNDPESVASLKTLFNHQLMAMCIPESNGGLGMDFKTYALVATELARQNAPLAFSWMLHVCHTLLTGLVMDKVEIPESKRLGHNRRRTVHYKRILENNAIYEHAFSLSEDADMGSSPFPTIAEPITGGWLVNGQKRIAQPTNESDYSDIDYYSVLCTEVENREEPVREKTVYLTVAKHESGVSIESDNESLHAILILKNVFVRERELLSPRGYYVQVEAQWPHMFLIFSPLYLGLTQAVCECVASGLSDESDEVLTVKSELEILLEEGGEAFYKGVLVGGSGEARATVHQAKSAHCALVGVLQKMMVLAESIEKNIDSENQIKLVQLFQNADSIEQLLPWSSGYCS